MRATTADVSLSPIKIRFEQKVSFETSFSNKSDDTEFIPHIF